MASPVHPDLVADALGLADRELVAFVGGHGKTDLMLAIARRLPGPVVLTGISPKTRFGPATTSRWFNSGLADHLLVRADRAHGQPFTVAPPTSPDLPRAATLVVACIGAEALGKVIADRCDRPMRVAAAAECSPYRRLTPERAADALLSERGSSRNRPVTARFVVAVVGALAGYDDAARLAAICTSRGTETIRVEVS